MITKWSGFRAAWPRQRECVVYWYSFSNPRSKCQCIHCDNCLVITTTVTTAVQRANPERLSRFMKPCPQASSSMYCLLCWWWWCCLLFFPETNFVYLCITGFLLVICVRPTVCMIHITGGVKARYRDSSFLGKTVTSCLCSRRTTTWRETRRGSISSCCR